eukprot:COSAG05_NODE_15903_length_358_cov_0.907336_1_plen_79_part_01
MAGYRTAALLDLLLVGGSAAHACSHPAGQGGISLLRSSVVQYRDKHAQFNRYVAGDGTVSPQQQEQQEAILGKHSARPA